MNAFTELEGLVNALGDAVVVCDAEGRITFWNASAERIFGFTQAEAIGASLDIIIPERMRKRHWDGYNKSMATGVTRYGTTVLSVPAVDKAGRTLSIGFTVAMLRDAAGKVTAIASVMRDETERFHRDRDLRGKVRDLEAQLQAASVAIQRPGPDLP